MKKQVLIAALVLLGMNTTRAAVISDIFTVYDATQQIVGQVGVNEDGSTFGLNAAVLPSGNQVVGEDPGAIYYINVPNLVNLDLFGFPVNLQEIAGGPYSDIFGIATIQGVDGDVLAFSSDSETQPPAFAPVGSNIVQETHPDWDATAFLSPTLQRLGYTATFFSDTDSVPEPATAPLVGAVLLGLAGFLRKRRVA